MGQSFCKDACGTVSTYQLIMYEVNPLYTLVFSRICCMPAHNYRRQSGIIEEEKNDRYTGFLINPSGLPNPSTNVSAMQD